MATLYKIPLILVAAYCYDRSFVPPNIEPSKEQQKRTAELGPYEKIAIPIIPPWMRAIHWAISLIEIGVLVTHHYNLSVPKEALTDLLNASSPTHSGVITPTFLIGFVLLVAGSLIRFRCFAEMGRHFTFALSLRDNHQLITTGPYAIVRHPSYTAGLVTMLGSAMMLMGDGSWWNDGGNATMTGRFLAINFAICGSLLVNGFLRGKTEDAYLEKTFGEKWHQWAKDVPCRYIPGVC